MKLSYSSINTYETCPRQYRYAYVDRVPGRPSPALSFGNSLHGALYRFHNRPVPVAPPLPELLELLDDEWVSEGYAEEAEEAAYRDHARQVLERYHADNAGSFAIPAALEHRFSIEIEGVRLNGTIDRMDRLPGGGYEIIDYKTNRRLPPRSRVEQDLQLSIYYLAAQEIWGIAPERLTLYFLLPGERMTVTRTAAAVDDVRRRVATVAERIGAGRFDPRENPLCNWCDFQALCPVFRHRYEREAITAGEAPDPAPNMSGLVEEWVGLKREHLARWKRLDELTALINAYCEEHDYRRLYASDGSAIERRPRRDVGFDKERVRAALEPLGLFDRVLSVDRDALSSLVESRSLPPDVEDEVLSSREEVRTTFSLYLRDAARAGRR